MVSRKDAVMQNIRQELALANAQELMNVWAFNTHSVQQSIDWPKKCPPLESYREVLLEMCNETWEFIGELRTGEDT